MPHTGFHQHSSIDSADFTPDQTPGWWGPSAFSNYSENDRDCKYVLSSAFASVWVEWARLLSGRTFTGPLLALLLADVDSVPPHLCPLSGQSWTPCCAQVAGGNLGASAATRSGWWKNGNGKLWPSWAPWLVQSQVWGWSNLLQIMMPLCSSYLISSWNVLVSLSYNIIRR